MKIQKRDGSYAEYDESKVVQAVMCTGVGPRKAAELARGVTRRLRRPLTVSRVGDLTEDAMLKAGLYHECRQYIEYRTKRRLEREKRAIITGGVDENLKYLRASTLKVLRAAGSDISHTIRSIRPKCDELILSGMFIPDDIIIHERVPSGPYRITMPHSIKDQLHTIQYANKYAVYVDWNRTPQKFRELFHFTCAYTGCLIREGRFGGMLDMSRIPLDVLGDVCKRAAEFLSAWEGASGPGVIIPPGMDHKTIHDVLYEAVPDLEPTGIYGKRDDVWGDVPYRSGCPVCGGKLYRTESCVSCACGWSACST